MHSWIPKGLSRRGLLSGGLLAAGSAIVAALNGGRRATAQGTHSHANVVALSPQHAAHGNMVSVGEVDSSQNGFDPTAMLTDWDSGTVSRLPDSRTLRSYELIAQDKEIEIVPGVTFPAWT